MYMLLYFFKKGTEFCWQQPIVDSLFGDLQPKRFKHLQNKVELFGSRCGLWQKDTIWIVCLLTVFKVFWNAIFGGKHSRLYALSDAELRCHHNTQKGMVLTAWAFCMGPISAPNGLPRILITGNFLISSSVEKSFNNEKYSLHTLFILSFKVKSITPAKQGAFEDCPCCSYSTLANIKKNYPKPSVGKMHIL